MKVKKTLTFDDSILKEIEDYAEKNGISLSGAVSVLCMTSLNAYRGKEVYEQLEAFINEFREMQK